MSKASYWQRGESLDYKNSGVAAIEANTVVELPGRIGIAGTDIAPGAVGDLHVCGVLNLTRPAKTPSRWERLSILIRQASQKRQMMGRKNPHPILRRGLQLLMPRKVIRKFS